MAKLKPRTQDEQDIDVVFASLLDKLIRDPILVRKVPNTLFVFKAGDNYTFRFAPGYRLPVYLNGIFVVYDYKIDREANTVTLGESDMDRINGVLVSGLREASNAFGGMAIAMYRSIELARALEAAEAARPDAAQVALADSVTLTEAPPEAAPQG